MAKVLNVKENKVYWSPCDFMCRIEDAYWELGDFIAGKRLDGHDEHDQWYMAMHRKLNELLDLIVECP